MNNLHISLTEFRYESRVLKETTSLLNHGVFDKVYVASLYAADLEKEQHYRENLILNRFDLKTRHLSKHFFVQIFKYIEFFLRVSWFYKKRSIDEIGRAHV